MRTGSPPASDGVIPARNMFAMTIFVDSHQLMRTFLSIALLRTLSLAPQTNQQKMLIRTAATKYSYRICVEEKYSNVVASIVNLRIRRIIAMLRVRLMRVYSLIFFGFFSEFFTEMLF